jgi:quinol monooxygenase YgiN
MSLFDHSVSINPYFKISDQNRAAAKELLQTFCSLVRNEAGCLYYNFCFKGNVLTCREAYRDAAAVLAHIENCGEALGKFSQVAELFRIELLGPAEELDKLREPLAGMNPEYYVFDCGTGK